MCSRYENDLISSTTFEEYIVEIWEGNEENVQCSIKSIIRYNDIGIQRNSDQIS